MLHISVWDKDKMSDDLVGETLISVYKNIEQQKLEAMKINIMYEKKPVGVIYMNITFTPDKVNIDKINAE